MANTTNKQDLSELNGISIYQEGKRTVYSPFFSKKGYLITENNVKNYSSYIQGYIISILIFLIAFIIRKDILIPLSLALVFLLASILSFYQNFIKRTGVIENYKKPQRDSYIVRKAKSNTKKDLYTIIICCVVLAAATFMNLSLNQYHGILLYLMSALAIAVILYGLLHIYILFYKKKTDL